MERERRGRRIPILGLTAHAERRVEKRYHEARMDGCLAKPIRARDLRGTVSGRLAQASISN